MTSNESNETATTDTNRGEASFTDAGGVVWTLHDLGSGEASITSTRNCQQPETCGLGVEVRETFARWSAMLGDGKVPEPAGHRTMRARMEAGEPVSPITLGGDVVFRERHIDRGGNISFYRRWVMASAQGFTVPTTNDQRTEAEKAANALRCWSEGLWSLEVLEDDEVAGWYAASFTDDERAFHRTNLDEDLAEMASE